MKKVILAYSGGVDTSVCVKWLIEEKGLEVITYSADLGGNDINASEIREKALATGACKAVVEDLRDDFIEQYAMKALKAGAAYEGKYLLATALGRPLIARRVVEIADEEGASYAAHGCTGKGNDQVRFETAFSALDSRLKIIAPLREWTFKTREEEIEYAEIHGIPVSATKKSPYSIDMNIWGTSIECGVLEDPWKEPPPDVFKMTVDPAEAPNEPEYVEIGFSRGIPDEINGRKKDLRGLIEELNSMGGKHGVGRVDMVENRLVGIKSREIYEAPAGLVLYSAHEALESLVLDRETAHFKTGISQKYGEIVYYGLWYSPLREALDGFIEKTQERVSGSVRLKLYKGSCSVVGRKSPNSLYDESLATYAQGDAFDHSAAEGFIKLWGLPFRSGK
jgi:argininosuccinate synthase